MNNEEPYRNQAERLKQRIEKINEKVEDKDVLPPREDIHRQKKKKTKWKLKYPLIRLLVLFFILLPIIIFSVISYRDGAKQVNGVEKSSNDSVGYETINLEKSNEEEENLDQTKDTISEKNETEKPSDVVEQSQTTTDNSVKIDNTNEKTTDTQVSNNKSEVENEADSSKASTESEKSTIVTHTVQPNENLYRLAMMYYHSPKGMDIIIKANNLPSNQISVGQVLKIPKNN